MRHYQKFLMLLREMGFTDDSGNSIPTADRRYVFKTLTEPRPIIGNQEAYFQIIIGDGEGDATNCWVAFYFNCQGHFINHGVWK